jgi:hypothetical protein
VRFASEAAAHLRQEVGNRRARFIQALNAILGDLPGQAAALLNDPPPPGWPGSFLWSKLILDGETWWRLDCIVGKEGWPHELWVVDVFASEIPD